MQTFVLNPFEEDDLAALHDIVADVPNDFLAQL